MFYMTEICFAALFMQHLNPCKMINKITWSFKLFLWCKKNSTENIAIVIKLFKNSNYLKK